MSRIDKLIKERCPNGVEYKKLKEISKMQRGQSITTRNLVVGDIPVIAGGQEPSFYNDKFNRDGETITVSSSGAYAGYLNYWNKPILCTDSFSIKSDTINIKFLYHFLKMKQNEIYNKKKGAGIPHIHISDLENMNIPIPPIEVQEEIVKILDKFVKLEAELEAELEARKNQYEFWCGKLFDYTEFKKLSELAEICTGSSNTNQALKEGIYPFYTRSQEVYHLNEYQYDDESIITAGDGAGVGKAIHYVNGKYALHQRAYRLCPNKKLLLPKYLYFYMKKSFYKYIMGTAVNSSVTSIRRKMLDDYPIPVPSIEEQQRIVNILDKFDRLVNDISIGLPAEIEARRKQYEYYRNKLLSFEEVSCE